MLLLLLLTTIQVCQIQPARILGIIPSASYSHQAPYQPLWRELSLRGHEVTVMTTDPQKNASLTNLTEIDMSYTYQIYKEHNTSAVLSDETKSFLQIGAALAVVFRKSQEAQLSSPEVQNLIHNEYVDFDLLIVEAQLPGMLAFGWRFKCPIIAVASMDSAMQYHDALGNPIHPVINPDYNLPIGDADNMSFRDRLISFIYIAVYKYYVYKGVYPRHHDQMKKYFGNELPPFEEIQKNISMLFICSHPIFHTIRPLNPNTISVGGGMHIKEPKPLPEDLQSFLDEAKGGAIYFSLGSNVNSKILNESFIENILRAFTQVPFKVLLKMDVELKNVPSNVKVQKWMPQQDILRHPNVKLFITQGGLQSLQESVLNGIPLIGIPFFGDQITNVNKMVKRGYGVKLDKKGITKESLKNAILEVMNDPKYREKAREMGEIFKDEEVPSLQRAIYWTEYVIRHKGAKHLRSPVVGMPTWKYYMLDVIGCLSAVALSIIVLCCLVTRFIFRAILQVFVKSANKPKRQTKKYKKGD